MLIPGRDTLGILGIGGLAVICCAGLPAVVAFAAGLTLVGVFSGGVLVAVAGGAGVAGLRAWGWRDGAGRSSRLGYG